MEIQIRNIRPEDLTQAVQVEQLCFPPLEAAGEEALKKRIEAFSDCFFVAEHQGRIVGFINGCVTNEKTIRDEMFENASLHLPGGAYQSVFGLDVIPEYRNQKIAENLMKHLIEDARERGRKGLILTCKEHLIHYYERFGYVKCGVSESVHGGAVWYDMILEL